MKFKENEKVLITKCCIGKCVCLPKVPIIGIYLRTRKSSSYPFYVSYVELTSYVNNIEKLNELAEVLYS